MTAMHSDSDHPSICAWLRSLVLPIMLLTVAGCANETEWFEFVRGKAEPETVQLASLDPQQITLKAIVTSVSGGEQLDGDTITADEWLLDGEPPSYLRVTLPPPGVNPAVATVQLNTLINERKDHLLTFKPRFLAAPWTNFGNTPAFVMVKIGGAVPERQEASSQPSLAVSPPSLVFPAPSSAHSYQGGAIVYQHPTGTTTTLQSIQISDDPVGALSVLIPNTPLLLTPGTAVPLTVQKIETSGSGNATLTLSTDNGLTATVRVRY